MILKKKLTNLKYNLSVEFSSIYMHGVNFYPHKLAFNVIWNRQAKVE